MSSSRSHRKNTSTLGTPAVSAANQTVKNPNLKKNEPKSDNEPPKTLVSMEPDFYDPRGACHMIYWTDCIAQMAVDIRERQNAANQSDFDFMKPKLVEYVFTVCVRLRLPNEVRFTAALILNSFMLRHLCSLHDFMERQEMSIQRKKREWENLESNMERQIPLRILTAIQISSKFHSYHDSLSSRQVVNTLRKIGLPYTITAVLESEQRVFKLIGFKMPDSPLDACEMALKVLTFTMKKRGMIDEEKYNDLWQHTLIVLDVCFINHIELYERFIRKCPAICRTEERLNISKFKWDIQLLAAATVQTAYILLLGTSQIANVSVIINNLLRCDNAYVEPLKQSIIELACAKKNESIPECSTSS